MERIALKKLIDWNNNKRKKPLIVWGARQVGKTYLVEEIFAKTYYEDNYIYIDCKKEDEIREFCSNTANAEKIIEYISLRKGKPINAKTLLIFDEVQECPNIISSLKYFCQDFRDIPVIATGSMVRIKLQRETHKRGSMESEKFLFPVGKINQMTIYPMTFDEFLMNSNRILYDAIKNAYDNKQPLDNQIHELAMEQVYKYLLVGGMPEAVEAYVEGDNLLETREILKVLYDNYLSDMELYQASQEAVLRSRVLFQNIFRELNKESKNFSPGLIEEKSKTRDYATSIQWLTMAHIVNQSFQLKEHITMPLMPDSESNFRLFLGDIGMFSYQSGADDHVAVVHTENVPMKAAIFLTSAIHRAAHTGRFDYGHNFYAKDADMLNVMLPEKDGKPDYDLMEILISAIQKIVIKDVVLYTDKKIAKTREITDRGGK